MQERRLTVRDVELCFFEAGDPADRTVLFVHATGFHARCWDKTIDLLGDGFHVIALDTRGHGRSAKTGPFDWSTLGADLTAFVAALELSDVIAVGHSMGGHCVVQAAVADPARFSRIVLVDPTIVDPSFYTEAARRPTYASAEEHPVSKRKRVWSSPEEMFERFKGRHPFSLWQPDILMDYCVWGLLRNEDGSFGLACPPIVEASIYLNSSAADIIEEVKSVQQPTTVLRGFRPDERAEAMDFAASPTYPGLAALFANGKDVYLPELTHFIPMQDPGLVAGHIVEAARTY